MEYVFKHAITQQVAYNSLLQQTRKKIHKKIGRAIEAIYAQRLEEFYEILVHHYSKSDDDEKAYYYLKRSGDKVIRNYSAPEAFTYYKSALEFLKKLPNSKDNQQKQVAIIHKMLVPTIILGFSMDSLPLLQYGVKIASVLDDIKSLTRFYSNMGVIYNYAGKRSEGRQYLEKAFQEAEQIEDVDSMAHAGPDIAMACISEGDYPKAIDLTTRITDRVEKTGTQKHTFGGPVHIYPAMTAARGYACAMLGDFESALILCAQGLRDANNYGNIAAKGIIEFNYGTVWLARGEWDNAGTHLKASIRYCDESSFFPFLALARSGLGLAETESGNPDEGKKYVEEGLRLHREANIDWSMSIHLHALSICYYYLGDFGRAIETIDEAHRLAQKNQENHYIGKCLIWQGKVAGEAQQQKQEQILTLFEKGLKILTTLQTKPDISIAHLFLGEHHLNRGDTENALHFLAQAKQQFKVLEMTYWLGKTQSLLAKL